MTLRSFLLALLLQHVSPQLSQVGVPSEALAAEDPAAAAIARGLQQEGLAAIDDYGLDIGALAAAVDEAFANPDPAVTSVASNGASMATRVHLPALAPK